MKKTFVIGDIHGCYKSLCQLLDKITPNPEDTLVFLGDYIDRGPDSRKVIEKLLQLRESHKQIILLMGNHEISFLNFLQGKNRSFYLAIGGIETLKSYQIAPPYDNPAQSIPPDHLHFLNNLLSYWEDEDNIFVHAGLEPGVHMSQQSPEWLFWARHEFLQSRYAFPKRIIFGHTAFKSPFIDSNRIGIDTGSVYGGKLTCLVLPNMEFISVEGETKTS